MKTRLLCPWMLALGLMLSTLLPSPVSAQGILLSPDETRLPWPIPTPRPNPRPNLSYAIENLDLNIDIDDQIAKVQLTQVFVNHSSSTIETSFVFPLAASPSELTFLVDGKQYAGEMLTADEARKIYDSYVRKNRDPALLEWIGYGLYKTSVFPIPAGQSRTVTLKYRQLASKLFPVRNENLYELRLPMLGAKFSDRPLKQLSISLNLKTTEPTKNVYVNGYDTTITRIDEHHVRINYLKENVVPGSDFCLFYDTGEGMLKTQALSVKPVANEDGYFLLLAAPKVDVDQSEITRKSIVFVIDRSGSMSGKKIEQARQALLFCLNHLNENDLFNIIAYDTEIELFENEMQNVNEQSRESARKFVERVVDGGSTNINAALTKAVSMMPDNGNPGYVVFLTDGLPTAGETKEAAIASNVKQANAQHARIFSFGVGYDVNSRLLDRLSREHNGLSEYVRPNEDLEGAVSRFYAGIAAPVMTDVSITLIGENGQDPVVTRMYPSGKFDVFAGQQIIIAGRYRHPVSGKAIVTGLVNGQKKTFEFPITLTSDKNSRSQDAFVAQLWATRRVGELIDLIDLEGKKSELMDELVLLAKKHGIITPYTSFLADDSVQLNASLDLHRQTISESLSELSIVAGESAVNQRFAKQDLAKSINAPMSAPSGNVQYYDYKTNQQVTMESVRQLTDRTYFRKDGKWIDANLKDEQVASAKKIVAYSDDYFELASTSETVRKALSTGEAILIEVDEIVYEIVYE